MKIVWNLNVCVQIFQLHWYIWMVHDTLYASKLSACLNLVQPVQENTFCRYYGHRKVNASCLVSTLHSPFEASMSFCLCS